ncbi:aminopeptidase P family protein [Rhizobium laguerreae]|uniref:M24 family metallopeptidase n=1 Tax=Rhizobium laguerreae TaxID=1076926 RepID=UPI001C92B4EB|nr:Xaa-Pro peptidase family protein [Rhizobium laguerreae]MBY3282064.1 aminopeptidase P family protein [Rhizobium laguerreae]MBY3293354.1 aminopeptidase P family protein [Rhizobium laguerreae]
MKRSHLAFSESEFRSRLGAVRNEMARIGVEVAVFDQVETMAWLTGFSVGETMWRCCVVTPTEDPFLIIRSLDVPPCEETTWLETIVGFRDWDDPHQVLVRELEKRGLANKAMGIEFASQSMSLSRYSALKVLLPSATFRDFGGAFWAVRTIKSEAEIKYLRRAAEICDETMLKLVDVVRIGGFQRELLMAASDSFLGMGGDRGALGIITTGVSWDALHSHEQSGPIEKDTIVHIELCPKVSSYSSRLMRSIIVGKATERQQTVAEALVDIQDRQMAAIKPGASAREIDALARGAVMEQGLRPSFDNVTGYTLGCFPASTQIGSEFFHGFTPGADWEIKEGMALHMYLSAEGLAFSESLVVRANGIERLTKSDRKLFEATV